MQYDVSVVAEDRFEQEDCKDEQKHPESVEDCRWLRIKNTVVYDQFLAGTLPSSEGGHIPTLGLTRFFKKTFTLTRTGLSSWAISDINTYRKGLEWSAAKPHHG